MSGTSVTRKTTVTGSGTRRSPFVAATSSSAKTTSGSQPSQNLLHHTCRSGTGAVRRIHHARPSRLTIGKMKRTATAVVMKAPSPRFRIVARSRIAIASGVASPSGRAEKL